VAAAVLAMVAVVAAVVVAGSGDESARDDGSGGSGSGVSGEGADGWVSDVGANSTLLADTDEVVCSTAGSLLYCLDAETGDEVFTEQLDDGSASSPVVVDDRVLVATSRALTGRLHAFGLDGEALWDAPFGVRAEREMPVVDGVVTVVDDDELVGVDVSNGEELWRTYTSDEIEGPNAVGPDTYTDGTHVYAAIELIDPRAGDASGHVVAVDPASGREVWRSPLLGDIGFGVGVAAAAPFDDGSAVVFLMGGDPRRVIVLDAGTGQLLWEAPIGSDYASIVHVAGATVVADGADMRSYDAEGRQSWHVPAPVLERTPSLVSPGELVFDDGRLFAAGYDVYEIDPASGASQLVREGVSATDVAVVGDLLVIAGIGSLEALPLASIGD
jgi:outer membrane protein assembly factor BamB